MKSESKILITRKLNEKSILKEWILNSGSNLTEQAFISFKTIKNLEIPRTDWIFFSSPTGLELYLNEYPILAKKIAVYSEGTNEKLISFNKKADFIGDSSENSKAIALEFFNSISAATVLFPSSQISTRGIVSEGKKEQVHEMISYETIMEEIELKQSPNVIIFTSPSNVDGFLRKNDFEDQMQVIAFGETTSNHLSKFLSKERILVPNSPKEADLIALLKSL